MLFINTLLPFLLLLLSAQAGNYTLKQDLEKDIKLLTSSPVFISDNTSASPTVQTIAHDLQLFGVVASINLSNSKYSHSTLGKYKAQQWQFTEGNIKAIYQIETSIVLDTVITQRYLENKAPTQHRLQNKFTFRAYAVSTEAGANYLYYLTEADQGVVEYRIDNRQVQINYPQKKEGLSDILPKVKEETERILALAIKE